MPVAQGEHCQLGCNLLSAQCSALTSNQSSLQSSCSNQCFQTYPQCAVNPISNCASVISSCVTGCMNEVINDCESQYNTCQTSCTNACGYALEPYEHANLSSAGASGLFTVSSAACAWTVVNNVPVSNRWLNVTSGSSGTGNGTIGYTVAANTGPARTGTLTVANKTFTVTQNDGCGYGLQSTGATVTSAGGSGGVTLTRTNAGCLSPAVSSGANWITATVNSSGNVSYTVSSNTGASTRTGTITIAGNTFTVTQTGCTYSISSNVSMAAAGGTGSVTVTPSGSACGWTAASNASAWATVASGASGTGSGQVSYNVSANTGPARTGTITIAGKTFTISQDNGCTYSISPTSSGTINISGGTGSFTVTPSNSACTWTTTNNASSWVTITGGNSGTGTGQVSYSVGSNSSSSPPRSGTITAGGKTYTVSQAGMSCNQYCTQMEQMCTASCTGQCQAQIPPECYNYPAGCMPFYQACVAQCPAQCSSTYSSCMASCQ